MNLTTYTHKNIIMFTETTLPVQIDGGLFVRLCKSTGGLFVRLCKSTGVCLSACAKMTGVYLSGGLFVRDSHFAAMQKNHKPST